MAQTLDSFDFATTRQGRSAQYPYEEWFDGKTRMLVQGSKEDVKAGKADFNYGQGNSEASRERAETFISGLRTSFSKLKAEGKYDDKLTLKTAIVNENGGTTGDTVNVVIRVEERQGKKRGRPAGSATNSTPAATDAPKEKVGASK